MAGQLDYTHMEDVAGMDVICNNTRSRAIKTSIVVPGTGGGGNNVTFPANPLGVNYVDGGGTPVSITTGSAVTLYPGQLLSGIITIKPTAGINVNFDTAAMIVAGANLVTAGLQVGDYICCLLINGSTSFALSPQSGGGVTFDANNSGTIPASTSRYMFLRMTNITPGSEAVVVYY